VLLVHLDRNNRAGVGTQGQDRQQDTAQNIPEVCTKENVLVWKENSQIGRARGGRLPQADDQDTAAHRGLWRASRWVVGRGQGRIWHN
jgi:hypothetical protein